MKITILCTDPSHPVNAHLEEWRDHQSAVHQVDILREKSELKGGDLLFLISCGQLIGEPQRRLFGKTLVIHAADLPKGRGWSPHIWQIIEGRTEITVSLLEAEDKVDSGDIWRKITLDIPKHFLWDEINQALFQAECELMDYAVEHFNDIVPRIQDENQEATYYPKRTPADSEVDPKQSLAEQFDLIRVCDPDRFPAFFNIRGHKYKLILEKIEDS